MWAPEPIGLMSFIKRDLDISMHTGRISCEHEDRDQGNAMETKEDQRLAAKPPEAKHETQDRFFLSTARRRQPS